MAVVADKVIVEMEARLDRYNADVNRATQNFDKNMRSMQDNAARTEQSLSRSFRNIVSAAVILNLGRQAAGLSSAWGDLQSRVDLAAGSMTKGAEVMERITQLARTTYSSLENTAEGFLRNSSAMRELGYTTNQTLDYVEAVNNAIVISGLRGQEAASVMDALSRAMSLGALRGDELNTVLQRGDRIATALTAALGPNGTRGELLKLGQQGRLTNEWLFESLTSQGELLRNEAESMEATIADAMQLIQNSILEATGEFFRITTASSSAAEALILVADKIRELPAEIEAAMPTVMGLIRAMETVAGLFESSGNWGKNIGDALGTSSWGPDIIQSLRDGFAKSAPLRASEVFEIDPEEFFASEALEVKIKPIIEGDLPLPALGPAKPTGRGRGDRENTYAREIRQLQERTVLARQEIQLIGETEFARDRALAIIELENAALQAKIPINDKIRSQIEETADAYAYAAEQARQAETRYQAIQALQQEFGDMAISGITGLIEGTKTLNDVLAETAKRIAEMALQAALLGQGPLAALFGTSNSSGGIGGIIGSIFGGFRANGGPVSTGSAYMVGERGPEMFVPGRNGMIVPNNQLQQNQGSNSPSVTVIQDNRGADPAAVARLEQNQPLLIREAVKQSVQTVRDGLRTNSRFLMS